MTERWLALVNPTAGRGQNLVERTEAVFRELGLDVEVVAPVGIAALEDCLSGAVTEGIGHFAVVGGDGSLNAVVNGLLAAQPKTPPVLSLLPAGTGSDFARMFALPQTVEGAAPHLRGTEDYPLDVGYVEGNWGRRAAFVNVAEAGIGAASAGVADRLPRFLGAAKYQTSFWMTLPRFRPAEIRFVSGRRRYEGPALAAIFANGQFFGGGLNIAPKAAVMDGILDLQLITARRIEALTLFSQAKRGMHLTHRSVRRMSGTGFELEVDRAWPVEVDGEYLGTTPVSGSVAQGKLFLRI